MDKKVFEKPLFTIINFENDIIVTSSCDICDKYDCGTTDGKVCCDGPKGHWQG